MVDVVIVNWNGLGYCRRLLPGLKPLIERCGIAQVIVVDNGSTDGSISALAEEFPWVKLIANPTNDGFAAANNLALEICTSEYVWLLNNDTEIIDNRVLESLQTELDQDSRCAAVGPFLTLPTGAPQTGAAGFEIGVLTAFNHFFFLTRAFPRLCRGFYLNQRGFRNRQAPVDVDWLCGAAMLVRRAPLQEVGNLPTEYFMYAEDLRLCRKLRHAGYRIKYVPRAHILHHHGGSEESAAPKHAG